MENSYREFLESSEMSTKEFQLQDVLDIQWGDTNTTKASYVPEGYLAFSASGPDGFLEKFDYDREGIVLSAIGANCGSTFFASGKWSCIKNTIRIFPKSESVDLRYFYYMTKSPDFWPIRGSAQPFISQTDIREMYAEFPEIELQRNVADLLSRIDRLIKVNQKLGSVLEEVAETIFESWFINFDPVKARMVGEAPVRADAETAALFPDSMEESELGEIPTGWVAQPLDSIADYLNGLALQKFPVVDDSDVLPVIKIAQLRAGHTRGADFASGSLDPRYVIEDGDILFSWSGTLEVEYWTGGRGALNQHLFKVSGNTVPDWFAYFATRSFLGEFRAIASSKATTMGHIQRRHLTEALLAVPPNDVLEQASRFIGPLVSLRTDLLKQNTTLGKLRDSLLPRLISGELKIPDEMLAE